MLERFHRAEKGVAMIVALLVSFVVLIISISVMTISIHSLQSSGYDRERLLSVNAAEAGLNRWFEKLEVTPLSQLPCGSLDEPLLSGPTGTEYSASVTYYRGSDGTTELTCPLVAGRSPRSARIVSTGLVSGTERTMETFIRLDPNTGNGVAILATNGATFGNNSTLYGDESNDADVYITNGNLTVNQQVTFNGNVFVSNGSAAMSGSALVRGDLWAKLSVSLQNPAIVEGSMKSTSGTASGTGRVLGDVAVGGATIQNSLKVTGTKTTNVVMSNPPTQTFPQITTSLTSWTAAGFYTGATTAFTSCATAWDWIRDSWGSSGIKDVVVRITASPACTFSEPANNTITMHGSLAIINSGGYSLSNHPVFQGSGNESLYLISPYTGAACSGTTNITLANQVEFLDLNLLLYTPCTVTLNNQNRFTGQVLGGIVSVANNFSLQFSPVEVPGVTVITGFDQDIAYIRETN